MTTDSDPILPSITAVKPLLGGTWFSVQDNGDSILLETRENGDVGSDNYGEIDLTEGRRLLISIRQVYPVGQYQSELDVCDEWVTVNLRKSPLTIEELTEIKIKQRVSEVEIVLSQFHASLPTPEGENVGQGITYVSVDHSYMGSPMASIHLKFGSRILYKERKGAEFQFTTEEQAMNAGYAFIADLPSLPLGKWNSKVSKVIEKKTCNYSAPHDVIERYQTIKFIAPIELNI